MVRKVTTSIWTLLSLFPAAAAGYQAQEVKDGGSIAGQVLLKGTPPRAPRAAFPAGLDKADRHYCHKMRPLVSSPYAVGKGARLANVVVWLEGVKKGKPRARKLAQLSNKGCQFVPLVQSMEVGAKLEVINDDPIQHTTHPIYVVHKTTAFNVATSRKGQRVKKKIRRKGIMRVQCDSGHTWMRAWIHAFKHPYHVVTGKDGRFELTDIPPGTYTVRAWHERGGTLSRKVVVRASRPTRFDLSFTVK